MVYLHHFVPVLARVKNRCCTAVPVQVDYTPQQAEAYKALLVRNFEVLADPKLPRWVLAAALVLRAAGLFDALVHLQAHFNMHSGLLAGCWGCVRDGTVQIWPLRVMCLYSWCCGLMLAAVGAD